MKAEEELALCDSVDEKIINNIYSRASQGFKLGNFNYIINRKDMRNLIKTLVRNKLIVKGEIQ